MNEKRLNELREYYDNTDLSQEIEQAQPDDTTTADPMIGVTVRFRKSALGQIRAEAARRGVKTTALIRDLAQSALADEPGDDLIISVADLQRLIAERSRPAA